MVIFLDALREHVITTASLGINDLLRANGESVSMPPKPAEPTTLNGLNGVGGMPKDPAHHGAPTRDWINSKVTGVLLEGMRLLALERPENPLRALGEYLIKRSAEIEGTGSAGANGS